MLTLLQIAVGFKVLLLFPPHTTAQLPYLDLEIRLRFHLVGGGMLDSIAISQGILNAMNIQLAFEEWKHDAKKQRSENRDFPRLMRALKKQKQRHTNDDVDVDDNKTTIERISAEMTLHS